MYQTKTIFKLIIILCCTLVSCQTSKKTSYMQNVADKSIYKKTITPSIKFQPNDVIAIIVSSRKPEMSEPFNLPSESNRTLGYLVDTDGNIDFPVIGKIKIAGLTRAQLAEELKQRLIQEDLISEPFITIEILNFQVSVLGEVAAPGTFTVSGDKITIFQVLGMAGDMTIYGRRDNVLVQRQENDQIVYHRIDLRYSNLIYSPAFYLQQNDVVYVEATNARAAQSRINENRSIGLWVSLISLLISVTMFVK